MSNTKHEYPTNWRALKLSPVLLLVIGACSSSPPIDNAQMEASSSGTTPTKMALPSSTNGGVSKFDAGTSSADGGMSTSVTSGQTAGSKATAQAGSAGTQTMDAGPTGEGGAGGATAGAGGEAGSTGAGAGAGASKAGTTGTTAGSGGRPMRGTRPDDEDAGVCIVPDQNVDLSNAKKCPADICPAQDSVCLPVTTISLLVPQSTIDLLSNCTDTDKCVPIAIAQKAGKGLLPSCRSINGAEGRCTSQCVPLVSSQKTLLPKDTCQGEDLCAPCFDPRTGEDTLACRQGCDPGPSEPARVFDKCCSDRGLCVPPALAGAQAKNLDKTTCQGENLCAPKELADPTFKPKSCESLEGAEGRCISTCVGGALGKQRDRLPTAGCAENEVCAPCFDPITGEDSGACSINGDKPAQEKKVFARCCGTDVGVCVPPALAGSQAMALRQEECPDDRLCAPIAKAQDPAFKFKECSSLLGRGVCIHNCIVDPTQAALLSRSSCGTDELCAPCSLLGTSTGACD